MSTSLGGVAGHGALAGLVAGVAGAAAMYWLTEPLVDRAVALEESMDVHGGHESVAGGLHLHGGAELVSRPEQVVMGLLTVVVVGALIGVAFSVTHRFLASRLPGATTSASVMTLAALGFVCLTLAPAVVVPANPPAVGDPATVGTRTTVYLGSIVCAVGLCTLVVGVTRSSRLAPATRLVAATLLGLVGGAVLLASLPDVSGTIPVYVPADLIWSFRVASLTQIGLMWLVLGVAYAALRLRASTTDTARSAVAPAVGAAS